MPRGLRVKFNHGAVLFTRNPVTSPSNCSWRWRLRDEEKAIAWVPHKITATFSRSLSVSPSFFSPPQRKWINIQSLLPPEEKKWCPMPRYSQGNSKEDALPQKEHSWSSSPSLFSSSVLRGTMTKLSSFSGDKQVIPFWAILYASGDGLGVTLVGKTCTGMVNKGGPEVAWSRLLDLNAHWREFTQTKASLFEQNSRQVLQKSPACPSNFTTWYHGVLHNPAHMKKERERQSVMAYVGSFTKNSPK